MVEWLVLVCVHAVLTAGVYAVARQLHRRVGRESAARRLHGRYVLGWAVAGYAVGPLALAVLLMEEPPDVANPAFWVMFSYAVGMFCLLAGRHRARRAGAVLAAPPAA